MEKNTEYILEMRGITKSFYGIKALDDVTLQVKKGEIHGLVGENGAGKSTIMKILAGIYTRDTGEILFEGENITGKISAKNIEELGIGFIHQERYVVPHLTVAEMLFLGNEMTSGPWKLVQRKEMEKKAEEALFTRMGVTIPGNKRVSELTVGEQQLLQICRALLHDPKVVVFDEPTAVLAKKEADRLFQIIRQLRSQCGIIYISHYFGEILDLCDTVTVLRNGQKITTVGTEGMTIDRLVGLMIGRDLSKQYPQKNRQPGDVLLEVNHLGYGKHFQDVSFQVRRGEILGITGLMGSGHDLIGTALYDSDGQTSGEILYKGKLVKDLTPDRSVKRKFAYVPDDRRGLGAIQIMSVKENTTISSLPQVSKMGVIQGKAENERAESFVNRLNIKTAGIHKQCGFLSGGNQQKVVLAKWLSSDAELYILNQPTAGVDIGARAEIYSIIDAVAKDGAAVILITQDIQELYNMADRVITMYRGRVNMDTDVKQCTDEEIIVAMMGGGHNEKD